MVQSYAFETESAVKALLHACKHPSASVIGVFIGTTPSASVVEAGADVEPSSCESVKITDYIPLFHTQTCIGPCCESALRQVVHVTQSSGLTIVGLMEAESQVAPVPDDPQTPGRAILDRLVHNGCSQCNYFAMDNAKLGEVLNEGSSAPPFQVLGRTSAGKWVKSASVSASGLKCTSELSEILKRQLAGKVHHDLSDFDDHLDDLQRFPAVSPTSPLCNTECAKLCRDWQNVGFQLL